MIKATVEEEAAETQKYVQYILAEFVRHSPLQKGKKIEIKVIENVPPFPEITEETDYYKAGRLTIPEADYERERREVRTAAFIAYHTKRFKGLFSLLNPSEIVGNVLRGTLKFAVVNPEKIIDCATGSADTIFLNSIGDLWREPKSTFCYEIREKSNRHKIVRFLVENNGYQQTLDIAHELGEIDNGTVRGEIGKINSNARKYIKLADDNFIESKKGSGYRINPKYKITLVHL